MFVVLIEAVGIQKTTFASNKRREAVGASQMVRIVGAEAEKAAGAARKILATSGKAMFVVDTKEQGQAIVREVTTWAVREAPGLEVRGVVVEIPVGGNIGEAVEQAHKEHARLSGRIPGPAQRFQRLPVVVDCATSGLPAREIGDVGGGDLKPQSAISLAKRNHAEDGWNHIKDLFNNVGLVRRVEDLDDLSLDWLAVIHIDGNRLGQIFLNLFKLIDNCDLETYCDRHSRFSKALQKCMELAVGVALQKMRKYWDIRLARMPTPPEHDWLPVVPLILAGDDLTLVCDGRLALPFVVDFLQEFRRLTKDNKIISELAQKATGVPFITACAGVAIVKPHFPFHAAYELADGLLRSAKLAVKTELKDDPVSAVDFHIHYDASGSDLDDIRARLVAPDGARLVARPYLVSDPRTNKRWAERRHFAGLQAKIEALREVDTDGKPILANAMLHDLRSGLFLGRGPAEARRKLAQGRVNEALNPLLVDGQLFWKDDDEIWTTDFLDVMDLADFWPEMEAGS